MLYQSTVNTLRPVYNLVKLELDDYEENELVLDTIHDLKLFFENSNNCTCRRTSKQRDLRTCFEKVGFKCFFERYFELKALEEHELEFFIKSQLMSFAITDEKSNNKTSIKYTYKFNYNNSLPLWLTERVHRNTEHASKTESRVFLDFNITFSIKQFLIQYGTIYGFSSPLRHQDDSGVFIYFPTSRTYVSVYNEFKESFYLTHNQSEKIAKLLVAKQDINKYSKVQVEYDEHKKAADLERQYYNNNVEEKIGKVYASKKSGGEENSFQLLRNNTFDKNSKLDTISTIPLSDDHKKYLYTRIRQHIDDQYKDILCPQPDIISLLGVIRNFR
ncbi:30025_t:CDS:2 [Racocetra persica]|uniref:30025_t:CDS:1 n=1 Tax=Racocetra persica TaxID=160502 RepID=A0ACA9M1A5_9GLOM|nr:30025_t:CDS:2 [Racocetra persica]